jgi:two-component system, OmpR family, sensor histidine kinase VanS
LMFGLLGGWMLAGRMLAPVTRITAATRMAGNGSLSHRIRMEGPGDEFRELADAFDSMLERLEANVAEQQRFAANASHELRTPLAISRTLLDVARRDPTRDRGELIERLHVANTRAIRLIDALLLLSRGDRATFTSDRVDLSLLAEEATETLLPLAEQRQIALKVTGAVARTRGSTELLSRMVTNLVENAIVHNLPADGSVTVRTRTDGNTSMMQVENTGRRIPAELLPSLTEPFQRGTERARTDEHVGAGLGLAIVRSIVRAHGGTLDLVPGGTGGLIVTVRLPGTP